MKTLITIEVENETGNPSINDWAIVKLDNGQEYWIGLDIGEKQ